MTTPVIILKFKDIDISKINIDKFSIQYENTDFYIQTPIFNYEIINYDNKKYLELKIDYNKTSHIKFLTFLDALELKIMKENNSKNIKTQIITNIQNEQSVKVKLLDKNTTIFDRDKNLIENLTSNFISLLLNIEYFNIFYSITAIQILEL